MDAHSGAAAMIRFVTLAGIFLGCALAKADDFPAPRNTEPLGKAPPLAPEAAAKAIGLPQGFSISVFAAEPRVQNPIGIAWDARGRMWVAENYTYAESPLRFDLSHRDRVVILEDADNDGVAEKRSVFTDQVQMLTSVEVGQGGVWLMCPPRLLFIPDRDGDDRPDGPPQTVLDGFEVGKASSHNFANGLRWGPDGWLYGRCGHSCPGKLGVPGTPEHLRVPIRGGIWRYHPGRKVVEVLTHGTTNPWGHDWDANGELFFVNTVNGHLWHLMPGAHLREPSGVSQNPGVYQRLDTIADHYHFDTRGGWQNSRDGKANDLGGGHAHCGAMIYQGRNWPAAFSGKLLTLNLHGRRANVERLERSGAGFAGRHEPDILVSADPWFRGMEITEGPDGGVFVVDWSDAGECHENTGVHRTSGRIYKVTHGKPGKPALPMVTPRCAAGTGRLPALWADYRAGKLAPGALRALLDDPDEKVRAWGIRLITDFWPLDTLMGPLPEARHPSDPEALAAFTRMARTDPGGLVRLALASVIQRLPVDQRAPLATALVARAEDAGDHNLPLLVWFGLIPVGDRAPGDLAKVGLACRWPDTMAMLSRHLAVKSAKDPSGLGLLLAGAADLPADIQQAMLAGMREGFQGWRKAPKPAAWDAYASTGVPRANPEIIRELNTLFGDGRAMAEVGALVLNGKADPRVRNQALQTLIDAKAPDLRSLCEKVLEQRDLSATAARGLTGFDDPAVARRLAQSYRRFHPYDRPAILEALVSRPSFARELLANLGPGKIPREDVGAYHVRQIRSLGDPRLDTMVSQAWGELRDTPADRRKLMAEWKARLPADTLAKADLSAGRALYQKACASCHVLYGEGQKVGPDLTGSGRSNIDYLLENIIDPAAAVPAEFRMTALALKDGRLLTGLVMARNNETLTLRTPTETRAVALADIEETKASPLSLMPDGLLQTLSEAQVRDLFAYLMHQGQVPLPQP
ncbi:MAG: c-type cytochrome [Planctomycetes bacterium]|nr:c-type cytochrome [Planctomycetota bacterium]